MKKYTLIVVMFVLILILTSVVLLVPSNKLKSQISTTPTSTKNIINKQKIIFDSPKFTLYFNQGLTSSKENVNEFSIYSDPNLKYFVNLFPSKSEYLSKWSEKSTDSDSENAGQGSTLLPEKININGNNYQKLVYYYNPITETKSGKFNKEISTIMSSHCVGFMPNGSVLMISPSTETDSLDGCLFASENGINY